MSPRHFLTLLDLSPIELSNVIDRARSIKDLDSKGSQVGLMAGMTMVMLFEKASTRTRISFEAAMSQFGGHTLFLAPESSQLSRGETLSDTARIISRMAELIVMRTYAHERIGTVADYSRVPVINAMSDSFHPCQLLADVLTFIEKRGQIKDAKVAWIGDGNNVCQSWVHAAHQFEFDLQLACPKGYEPSGAVLEVANGRAKLMSTPKAAVSGSDLVVTDTWLSIGNESEKEERLKAFSGFCVVPSIGCSRVQGS